MYTVKPYEPKIRLISNGKPQEIYEFENYNTFLDWCTWGFISNRIVNRFSRGTPWELGTLNDREYDSFLWGFEHITRYIVRDEFGSMFSNNEVEHDFVERRKELREKGIIKKPCWSRRLDHPHEFRKDPVPGTGHHYNFGHMFRSPHTTQELRRNCAEPRFTRGKRRKDYLPNSWDDVIRSDRRERKNWKRNRKTQWKVK